MKHNKNTPCCCNCKYQRKLYKHPQNKGFGEGSIKDPVGFVCLNPEVLGDEGAIYFDKGHGMCEVWTRKQLLNIKTMRYNKQTLLVNEHGRGNCYQAALSSILNVELYEVLDISLFYGLHQFEKECNITWEKVLFEFIRAKFNKELCICDVLTDYHRGFEAQFPKQYVDVPYLLFGKSLRGDFYHVVIFFNGHILHDPHPDDNGLDMSDKEMYARILI